MTRAADRLRLITILEATIDDGVRQHKACQCVGISERTFQRWRRSLDDWRPTMAPNQVWSSDITWLKSLTAGHWFYLYLIEDVFSRKMVGYEVHLVKSSDNAAELLQRTVLSERCWQEPLVLHADNGAPMKSPVL